MMKFKPSSIGENKGKSKTEIAKLILSKGERFMRRRKQKRLPTIQLLATKIFPTLTTFQLDAKYAKSILMKPLF